jgi:type II secretory pathway predicted ATPase ExeA
MLQSVACLVGAGKTVAVRAAVAALDPTRHRVIYIASPAFGARGLYVTIVRALGERPRYLKAELMAQCSDLLAAEADERHRRVVIIVDLCRARNYADDRAPAVPESVAGAGFLRPELAGWSA